MLILKPFYIFFFLRFYLHPCACQSMATGIDQELQDTQVLAHELYVLCHCGCTSLLHLPPTLSLIDMISYNQVFLDINA